MILGEDSTSISTAVIISATSMLATLCIVSIALALRKNLKKKAKARKMVTQDQNPIYGSYYFPGGVRIDNSSAEVEDQNELYEPEEQYDELEA